MLVDLHDIRMTLKTQAFTRAVDEILRNGGDGGEISNLIDVELNKLEPKPMTKAEEADETMRRR